MVRILVTGTAIAVAVWASTVVASGSTCYYLDGTKATKDSVYRCDNSTDVDSTDSACCNVGMTCWSNGVCEKDYGSGYIDYLRVGCTDPTWSSPECLDQCVAYVPSSSTGIRPCGGISSNSSYCCDPGDDTQYACCDDAQNIFQLSIPTVLAYISATYSSTSASTSTSSSTSATSSTTLSTTTTSHATSQTTSSTATSTASNSTSSSNTGTIVGAAVGVPVGLALIGGMGYFLWRRNRKTTAAAAVGTANVYKDETPGHSGYKYAGVESAELPVDHEAQPVSEVMGDTTFYHEVPGSAPPSTHGSPHQ